MPEVVQLVDAWAGVAGSREEAAFLAEHADELARPDLPPNLATIADLYPDHPFLLRAEAVVAAIGSGDFEELRAAIADANEATARIRDWIATPSRPASRSFFEANREQLSSEVAIRELEAAAARDPGAAQHLALVRLAEHVPLPDLFDAVDLANDMVSQGRAELLGPMLMACPALAQTAFYGPAVTAVALAVADRAEEATSLIESAIGQGDRTQRTAFASRLRRLAVSRPELADTIGPLVSALEASASSLS